MTSDRYRLAPARRWAIRLTAIGVLGAMLLNTAVPHGEATTIFTPTPVVSSSPAATKKAAKPAARPAETYPERQERIGDSERPMLGDLEENEDAETTCVSAEFTTLSVVYESVLQSLLPTLPAPLRAAALDNRESIANWMKTVTVSTLAVSDHPSTLGADQDDPQYRTAISQLVVSNLLKIRDGKQNEAIPVGNITLSQAVESVWLYVFAGILAPVGFGISMMPGITAAGIIPITQLMQIGFTGSRLGLQYLYQGTSSAVLNQCVARVTDEQKALAGKPSDSVTYDIPIHPLIQGAADQLALADNDTCTPIGDLSLGRIVKRTAESAKATAPTAAAKRQIDAETAKILRQMKATPVPHNLIPADPADFNTAESTLSMVGPVVLSAIPQLGGLIGGATGADLSFLDFLSYIGGAPLDMAIGLGHNIGQGDDLTEVVSVHDLTVTKSLTAAYYAYYFSLYLFTTIGGLLVPPIPLPIGGGVLSVSVSPTKMAGAVLGLPLTYGLITFHHVMRTMCFREDDLTGTGLGAEANKQDPEAHAEAVAEKKRADRTRSPRSSSARPSRAPRSAGRESSTPRSSAPRSSAPRSSAPRSSARRSVP